MRNIEPRAAEQSRDSKTVLTIDVIKAVKLCKSRAIILDRIFRFVNYFETYCSLAEQRK
jgi:hypothetical protein